MQVGQKKYNNISQLGIKSSQLPSGLGNKLYPINDKFNSSYKGPDIHNGIINNFNSVDAHRQPYTRPSPSQEPKHRNPGIEKSHRSKTPSSAKWG
jgi:hypothetical protein